MRTFESTFAPVTPINSMRQRRLARRDLITRAIQVMDARMADPDLSLKQVAAELLVSPRHLQRAFEEFGSSGYRHELCKRRMLRASELLESPEKRSVSDIAAAVGYTQPMHFAKAFRRQMGMSPREWRKRSRTSEYLAA